MDIFIPFPLQKDRSLQERLLSGLGTFTDSNGQLKDYVSVFNHDVESINNILNNPPSVYRFYEEALRCQEEYNQALTQAKSRWQGSEKSFDVGSSVIKDLSERRKRFEAAFSAYQAADVRQNRLKAMMGDRSADTKFSKFWDELGAHALTLDKKDFGNYRQSIELCAKGLDKLDSVPRWSLIAPILENEKEISKNGFLKLAKEHDQKNKSQKKLLPIAQEIVATIGTRHERLQALKSDWLSQSLFILASSKDLIKLREELQNFKAFLDYIDQGLNLKSNNEIDEKIRKILSANRKKLQRIQVAMIHAMAWRIHAASLGGNLRFDDVHFAIIKEIKDLVFLYDDKEAIEPVKEYLGVFKNTLSYELDFETCEKMLKLIKRSKNKTAINKWRLTQWAKDSDDKYYIPATIKHDALIPTEIVSFVPDKPGYTLTKWIAYWFFQTQQIANEIVAWFRKKLLGPHSEAVLFINESIYQTAQFKTLLEDEANKQKAIDLYHFSKTAAFLDAIEAHQFIQREKTRAEGVKPSWTMGVLLGWVPFFNRKDTYLFFQTYDEILIQSEKELRDNCQAIAVNVIRDLESSLFNSIKQRAFLLPKTLLKDLQTFLEIYATQEQISQFHNITAPIYILKRFNFLHDREEEQDDRQINDDNVFSFLAYAKKYWSNEQYEAAKLIAKIILKESLPTSNEDLTNLYHKTRCLLISTEEDKAKVEFMQLLKYIAKTYIFETGDDGDKDSYLFLKRFYPEAAKHWMDERNENLDDKYIFIRSLLDVRRYKEKDLKSDKPYDVGQTQLSYALIGKYILDIGGATNKPYLKLLEPLIDKYINQYTGSNIKYREIIYQFSKFKKDILETYVKKRLRRLLSKRHTKDLTQTEIDYFCKVSKSALIIETIYNTLKEKYDGSHQQIETMIEKIYSPKINGIYYAKRLQYLIKNKHFQEVLDSHDLFEIVKNNPFFINEMNHYFDRAIGEAIDSQGYKEIETLGFCHMVERYGSLVNKEAYRILRIKRLLELNDLSQTQIYVEALLPYVPDLNTQFVTLEKGKRLLNQIYTEHLTSLKENNDWRGHLQYVLSFFGVNQSKALLQECRLLWLKLFLKHPEKFSEMAALERPTLDVKYHYENLNIPTSETDLKQFYGVNINEVFELMSQRLDLYSENINNQIVNLIVRYAKDQNFKTHPEYMLLSKKIEDFKRAQQILHAIKEKDIDTMIALFDHFLEDHQGQKELVGYDDSGIKEKIIAYQQILLKNLYDSLLNHFKDSVVSYENVTKGQLDEDDLYPSKLLSQIKHSKIPNATKRDFKTLFDHRKATLQYFSDIYNNLSIETLNLLSIKPEQIAFLKTHISKQLKAKLLKRIDMILSLVPNLDPLSISLTALYQYIQNDNLTDTENVQLLKTVTTYNQKQKEYPKLSESLAQRIIARLEKSQMIDDLPLFRDENSSLRETFVKYLSSNTKQSLSNALLGRIKEFTSCEVENNIIACREEWINYSKLYQWLKHSNDINTKKLESEVEDIIDDCLEETKDNFEMLTKALDLLFEDDKDASSKTKIIANVLGPFSNDKSLEENLAEKESELLRKALLSRFFGNGAQRAKLDEAIDEISRRLHKAFMSGQIDPFSDHCIKYADRLIDVAGNKEQRIRHARLMDMWNRYLVNGEDLSSLQQVTVKEALNAYLLRLETQMYTYLKDKYDLDEQFDKKMRHLHRNVKEGFDVTNNSRIEKYYSNDSMLAILKAHAQKKGWFGLKKPTTQDATKLTVSFCLYLQAQQLIKLWLNKLEQGKLSTCDIHNLSEILANRFQALNDHFDVKSNGFKSDILKTINLDKEYFSAAILDESQSCVLLAHKHGKKEKTKPKAAAAV